MPDKTRKWKLSQEKQAYAHSPYPWQEEDGPNIPGPPNTVIAAKPGLPSRKSCNAQVLIRLLDMNSVNLVGNPVAIGHTIQNPQKALLLHHNKQLSLSLVAVNLSPNFSKRNHGRIMVHGGNSYCFSVEVGKEEAVNIEPESSSSVFSPTTTTPEARPENAIPKSSADPRLEEKFAVLNTGQYECRSCGYVYDQAVGDPFYPIPPGLEFSKLPEDWRCPTCGAAQSYFLTKSIEVAGFAQNQKYGLGGNALTSNQKSILIYGSLLFFFALFLLGYFIQ